MSPSGDLAVVIPARNESARICATVDGALQIPGVDIVVVVDDGSADDTSRVAVAAGATVVRHSRNRGKAAAMETGAEMVALIEADPAVARGRVRTSAAGQARKHAPAPHAAAAAVQPGEPASAVPQPPAGVPAIPAPRATPRHLLFLDGDLGESAAQAAPLAEPIRVGVADMAIAVFAERVKQAGHGLVLGLAGSGIERTTGFRPAEPLNGQRCLTRAAFEAARPLARRWGAETGLTIDLLRKGLRVVEVQVPLAHRTTGRDLRGQWHRARQFTDVSLALATRHAWRRSRTDGRVPAAGGRR
jgi:Glycosyl transferase family 2